MIWVIGRKEFREIVRDRRFLVTGVVLLALLLSVLFAGWSRRREQERVQRAATESTRQYWEAQGVKNPHSAAHFGIYAFKPVLPLSHLDQGVDPYLGTAVWMEAHKQNPFVFPPAENATGLQRLGEATAASALQLLLPLLIILLCFSSFAGERERGTLPQILSIGVSPSQLALGKAAGIAASLGILLLPALATAAFALAKETGTWIRLGLIGLDYGLYGAIFIAISLAVSAAAKTSRASLAVLLGFWTLSCLIVPRLAADSAERLYPVPTNAEWWRMIENDMRHGVDGHNEADERTQQLKRDILARYGVERIEDLPVNFTGLALQAGEEYGNRVFDRRYAELWGQYRRQDRLQLCFGLVSPLVAVRDLSMRLAGTDFTQHRDFALAAERYRRSLNKTMNLELAYRSRGTESYQAGPELWKSLPPFKYAPMRLSEALSGAWVSAGLVVYWLALSGGAAYLAAKRWRI